MPLFGSNTPLDITQLAAQRDVKMLIKALLYQKGMKQRFLHKKEEEVRQEAAKALGQIGDVQAVKPLISVRNHSDSGVRDAAVEALGKIGDARAFNPLLAALNDSSASVRRSASEALKRMEPKLDDQQRVQAAIAREAWEEVVGFGSIAVQPLIASIIKPKSPDLRKVIEALGQIGDVQAVKLLISVRNHSDSGVRDAAVEALGKIGDARAINPLLAALNDSSASVRRSASTALKRMEPKLDDQQRVQAAIARVAWEEVVGFGSIAVQPLIKALNEPKSPDLRKVIEALGQIGDARAVEPLINILNHSDLRVREAAIDVLGQIGDARAVKPLLAALNDGQGYVHYHASQALKQMEPKLDDQQRVQAGIAPADWKEVVGFGSIAVKPLIAALNDASPTMRHQRIIDALSQIGDVQAVQPLIAELNNSDGSIRYSAVQALGQIGDARAVKPLLAALNDSDSSVRSAAAQALKPMEQRLDGQQRIQVAIAGKAWEEVVGFGSAAVQPLITELNKGDISAAAKALAEIGDARAVQPLIAKLGDTGRFGTWSDDTLVGERVATSLQTIKLDPDWLTSERGSQAIGKLITALTEAGIAWQGAEKNYIDEWQHVVTPTTDARRIVAGIAAVIPNFGAQAIESVAALLNDKNWVVRLVAALTLARIGDTRAVEPLIGIVEDGGKKAREMVVAALEPLQEQLNDQQRAQLAIARKV